jgi:DNA-binding NtrC family response regulator
MVKRVLIVEDNLGTQSLLRNMLLGVDATLDVHCVSTAEAAFRSLNAAKSEERPYEVVVADVNLPGSSGLVLWDVARLQHPTLDFCFVSGMSYADWCRQLAKRSEWPPFMQKPISQTKLRQFWRERFYGVGIASS